MKCVSNCHCGKHNQHRGGSTTTYGEQQRQRLQRTMAEYRAKQLAWRGSPSDLFDWNAALIRFRAMMKEIYG